MDKLFSLQKLFTDRIFRIPDYQRGYAWTATQLSELWEDLMNLPEGKDHYTGMITLRQIAPDDIKNKDSWYAERWLVDARDYEADYIVDGQQRLTTFIICISAIVDFCHNHDIDLLNKQPLSDITERYLYITEPSGTYNTYIFGYETDNPSYNFFKAKILGNPSDSEKSDVIETFYTLNLENAKTFFAVQLNALYESEGLPGIEQLYRKLTQHMKFNLYNISDDFSVFVTFETMNNRGKRLSTLELLKNRLIYLSTLLPDPESSKIAVREKINHAWKEIYEYLGKNKNNPLKDDDYLQAHWIAYFGYQTKEENNFENSLLKKYFSRKRIPAYSAEVTDDTDSSADSDDLGPGDFDSDDEILSAAAANAATITTIANTTTTTTTTNFSDSHTGPLTLQEINDYVASIKSLVKYWYALSFPDDVTVIANENLKNILKRLSRLGYNYFKPLAMVILSKPNLDTTQKVQLLSAIERYIFLHFRLAGNVSTSYRSQFYGLTKSYYYDTASSEDILKQLSDVDCVQSGLLRTDLVYAKLHNLFDKYDGYYSWGGLRYFLYEYESYLKDQTHAVMKVDPAEFFKADGRDKVSIEHVYPQTPQGTWLPLFSDYDETQRHCFTGTLGNLLALSQSINSSLQNDDFSIKRQRYLNNSHSAVAVAMRADDNGQLVPREAWTPEDIKERGLALMRFMAEHWGFKFRNEYDMLKLLGLQFMSEEEETPWEDFVAEAHKTTKGTPSKRKRITNDIVEQAYREARAVHDGHKTADQALDYLERDLGMNRGSMKAYLHAFENMLKGISFTLDINDYALHYFVDHILEDYGDDYRMNIIKTLESRVARFGSTVNTMAEETILRTLRGE